MIGEYVVAFRDGSEDGLALGRQPRTVNHRLCVLASFFEFLERRDRDRGFGVWGERSCPVPVGRSAIEGSHGMPGRDVIPSQNTAGGYVFPYDRSTLAELEAAADGGLGEEPRR